MYNLQTKIEILTRNPKYMYMYMYRMTIIHTSNVQVTDTYTSKKKTYSFSWIILQMLQTLILHVSK